VNNERDQGHCTLEANETGGGSLCAFSQECASCPLALLEACKLLQLRRTVEVKEVEEYEEMDYLQLVQQPVVYVRRADQMVVLNPAEFQHTFRFDQLAVYNLVTMLND
jgi:hypothetical protein